jgi:isochorismate synthase/2-succinyl-5-enolpyruvyl-6-hydroxy-3-cyclohexene-1-carboxylate synthase/2-succinyl-6-hydroxy-2,4-cyclohexadiene-1-carboxylate synthase/O-succinylbenzoate synthase
MCRAHGIPHQKVSALEDLRTALHSAWGCNRHSVIEVITSRSGNVDRHREIQAQVKEAVAAALHAVQRQDSTAAAAPLAAAAQATAGVPYEVAVRCASYHAYSLPLAQPLTTTAPGQGGVQRQQHRQGFLLHVVLEGSSGTGLAHGVGEVAPLPGLHTETLQQAEQQLALLCQLLAGTSGGSRHGSTAAGSAHGPSSTRLSVPLTVSLLGGRMSLWLRDRLGVAPESLLPSVRCGLEAALLSALAQHQGLSLAQLLAGSVALTAGQPAGQQPRPAVSLNGLLDCQGSPAEAAAEAAQLLNKHPYSTLKIKVGRRADPAQDAAAVLAIRQAVGPAITLRADANRRWTLEQAVVFGKAVVDAGLQYVEEPVACTADLDELYRRTGLHLALDESVDEGALGAAAGRRVAGGDV